MQFKPGQYAFLRCACIDRTWHPFTIASRPGSSTVEFFIEVYNSGGDGRNLTWTESLWAKLCDDDSKGGAARGLCDTQTALPSFQIKGPYGTPLGTAPEDYSHCIAIGSGTGIVPVMSMLKAHAWRTMQINGERSKRHFGGIGDCMHILLWDCTISNIFFHCHGTPTNSQNVFQ